MSDETKLLVKLKDSNPSTRYEACEELRISSEISPEALSALQAAMNDADADIADAARRAYDSHTGVGPGTMKKVGSRYPRCSEPREYSVFQPCLTNILVHI